MLGSYRKGFRNEGLGIRDNGLGFRVSTFWGFRRFFVGFGVQGFGFLA